MSGLTIEALKVDLAGRAILHDISFEGRPGELIGLIGPNGAGKTTLLRAIAQLIVSRGEILWEGRSLKDLSANARANTLAFLPQGHELFGSIPVRRIVELGRLPGLGPLRRLDATDDAIVDRSMLDADVLAFSDRMTDSLSGGERARVLLARALAVDAPMLLADEPVAALDPYHALGIMERLRSAADAGKLVVVVMHDLSLVSRFCHKVVLLDRGRLVAAGSPRGVLTAERLRAVYRIEPGVQREDDAGFLTGLVNAQRVGAATLTQDLL